MDRARRPAQGHADAEFVAAGQDFVFADRVERHESQRERRNRKDTTQNHRKAAREDGLRLAELPVEPRDPVHRNSRVQCLHDRPELTGE